ncbi:MAG: Bacterial transcriptional activator domain [Chthonomonadaceae bacterium]|nr:Bacterial transcriptional activator domain [Chthonomonadaceae bacterium]
MRKVKSLSRSGRLIYAAPSLAYSDVGCSESESGNGDPNRSERERLSQSFLQALHRLTRLLAETGDYEQALYYARLATQQDSWREEAHRDAMRLYMALGRPSAALRTKSRSDKNLAGFSVVALLIGGLSGLAILGWNRQERDYALTDAVGRRDIPPFGSCWKQEPVRTRVGSAIVGKIVLAVYIGAQTSVLLLRVTPCGNACKPMQSW